MSTCPVAVVDGAMLTCERTGRHYVHEAPLGHDRRVEWRSDRLPQVIALRRVYNCPATISIEGYDFRCTFGQRRHSIHETAFLPIGEKQVRPVRWSEG